MHGRARFVRAIMQGIFIFRVPKKGSPSLTEHGLVSGIADAQTAERIRPGM